VDHKTAALLFYALQTASTNLRSTTFEPRPQQVVIDPRGIADTSLGDDAWYKEEFTADEDDQEEAEPNEESSNDTPATVNIQAMAAHGDVAADGAGNLRVLHVSFFETWAATATRCTPLLGHHGLPGELMQPKTLT
jgi:hypothetical protein